MSMQYALFYLKAGQFQFIVERNSVIIEDLAKGLARNSDEGLANTTSPKIPTGQRH